jgi:hypothetical protein
MKFKQTYILFTILLTAIAIISLYIKYKDTADSIMLYASIYLSVIEVLLIIIYLKKDYV